MAGARWRSSPVGVGTVRARVQRQRGDAQHAHGGALGGHERRHVHAQLPGLALHRAQPQVQPRRVELAAERHQGLVALLGVTIAKGHHRRVAVHVQDVNGHVRLHQHVVDGRGRLERQKVGGLLSDQAHLESAEDRHREGLREKRKCGRRWCLTLWLMLRYGTTERTLSPTSAAAR